MATFDPHTAETAQPIYITIVRRPPTMQNLFLSDDVSDIGE